MFLGARHGEALAEIYAAADVFVFPAAPTPSAWYCWRRWRAGAGGAFPAAAPSDVFGEAPVVLDEALRRACLKALECSREDRRVFALRMTWAASARMFLTYVAEVAKGAQAQAA